MKTLIGILSALLATVFAMPYAHSAGGVNYDGVPNVMLYDGFGNPISSTFNAGQYSLNVSGSFTASNPSIGTNGSSAPTSSTEIGLIDGTGKLQGVSSTNPLPVSGTFSNPSVGTTGSAVPASGTFISGKNGSGNLVGLLTGQQTMANSLACVLPSDQSAIPVSESGTWNVGLSAGSNIIGKVSIDQSTPGTTNGVQVNAALPAGTNVIGKVSIDQTTPGTTNRVQSNVDQVGGSALSLGQKTMTNSVPVTLASDQGPVSVVQGGRAQANAPVRNNYSTTNVTTSAWVQLVASTSNATSIVCVFDSSGQTLQLGTGGSGSEVAQMNIFPGGNGCEPLKIAAGTRVAVESLSATANTGELDINFYQ